MGDSEDENSAGARFQRFARENTRFEFPEDPPDEPNESDDDRHRPPPDGPKTVTVVFSKHDFKDRTFRLDNLNMANPAAKAKKHIAMICLDTAYYAIQGLPPLAKGESKDSFPEEPELDDRGQQPRITTTWETLLTEGKTLCGARMTIIINDADIHFDVLVEDRLKRFEKNSTNNFPPNMEYIQSKTDTWAHLISSYLGKAPEGTIQSINDGCLSPTNCLTFENGLRHMKTALECQKRKDNYKNGIHPIPPCMCELERRNLIPLSMITRKFPESIDFHLLMDQINMGNVSMITIGSNDVSWKGTLRKIFQSVSKVSPRQEARIILYDVHGMNAGDWEMVCAQSMVDSLRLDNIAKFSRLQGSARLAEKNKSVKEYLENYVYKINDHAHRCSAATNAASSRIIYMNEKTSWGNFPMVARNIAPAGCALLRLLSCLREFGKLRDGIEGLAATLFFASRTAAAGSTVETSGTPYGFSRVNVLFLGDGQTSKSHLVELNDQFLLPGTSKTIQNLTLAALTSGKSWNGLTICLDEMNPAMIEADGKPQKGGDNGSNTLGNGIKTMITMGRIASGHGKMTADNNRDNVDTMSLRQCSLIGTMNTRVDSKATPALSRWWVVVNPGEDIKPTISLAERVTQFDAPNLSLKKQEFREMIYSIHALEIVHNDMIRAGFAESVNTDLIILVLNRIVMRIIEEKNKPSPKEMAMPNPRVLDQIRNMAMAICFWCAVALVTGSESFGEERKKQYDPSIHRKIENLLVINIQHVGFALSLAEHLLVPSEILGTGKILQEGLKGLHFMDYMETDPRNPNVLGSVAPFVFAKITREKLIKHIAKKTGRAEYSVFRAISWLENTTITYQSVFVPLFENGMPLSSPGQEVENDTTVNYIQFKPVQGSREMCAVISKGLLQGELAIKTLEESWVMDEFQKIVQHTYTVPQDIITATPLIHEGKLISGAFKVMKIRPDPGTICSVVCVSAVTQHMEGVVLLEPSKKTSHISIIPEDLDVAMMARHHMDCGYEELQKEYLPSSLHRRAIEYRESKPEIYGPLDELAYDMYPEEHIARQRVTDLEIEQARLPINPMLFHEMRNDPSIQKSFYVPTLLTEIEREGYRPPPKRRIRARAMNDIDE
jgi:hypothetical protein